LTHGNLLICAFVNNGRVNLFRI